MEGQAIMGLVQGANVVRDELPLTEGEERDLGEEQMDAAKEGTTDPASKDNSNTADAGKTSTSLKARKRTKTGCLTCRKRRIKCGEERPTCGNCVKSKRNCEGYTPRVIFKHPHVAFRPTDGIHTGPFRTVPSQDENAGHYGRQPAPSGTHVPLPFIAPRPGSQEEQAAMQVMGSIMYQTLPGGQKGFGFPPGGQPYSSSNLPPQIPQHLLGQGTSFERGLVTPKTEGSAGNLLYSPSHPHSQHHQSTSESDSGIDMTYAGFQPDWSQASPSSTIVPSSSIDGQTNGVSPTVGDVTKQFWTDPTIQVLLDAQADQGHPTDWHSTTPNKPQDDYLAYLPQARQRYQQPNEVLLNCGPTSATIKTDSQYSGLKGNGLSSANVPHYPDSYARNPTAGRIDTNRAEQVFPPDSRPEIDDPEDDYFDVESDADTAADGHIAGTPTHDLGLMLAISASQGDKTFRSLTNYLNEPNVLASYHPTYSASPLMDPQTARLFCHFVTASAPTLSSCERHPNNPSVMFSGAPVPLFQRSLWTYSLPMLALSHQGLLHAMLAIASLHIARLQHTSPTPSLKHYHYALRRVSKAISQPSKRNHVATLAATLLLGWYEITTAEHNKWNSHLAGARQLIMDIDFAGMTKRVKAHKAQIAASHRNRFYGGFAYGYQQTYMPLNDPSLDNESGLDENLISTIMGWDTRYSDYGQVIENQEPARAYNKPLTEKEIETFEIQSDLFWWYAKQDMYQSIVSGNRLLLSYDRWSHCPPRAPIGKLDAVHGTMDHLLLLMARIADFAGKDQPRKRKVAELKERQQKAQQAAAMGAQATRAPNQSMPPPQKPMYGMMPDMGPVRLPAGFDNDRHASIPTAIPLKDQELDAATRAAEAEWAEICNALDTFEDALGQDYQPLSSEHMPPLSTPFGPALYYRTYPIHCVWALFYTGRIITARCQPSMPPAAMIAAGVAAPRTAGWANTIGRICAGLQPVTTDSTLNPRHGAALMDTCMALFHAGVQYRDAAQRGWTITKLRDVARLTGWQSSALIASGCERSWMKAAEMGRGPPYTRTMSVSAVDDRVSGRARDGNRGPPKDNNDRRFIPVNPGTRVYWALGILGLEEDMKDLDLKG